MRDYLTRLLGSAWEVDAPGDGRQALARIRQHPPDLVLADVMMPALDGFALLRAIRADQALAAIPVMLVTARAAEESAIEGLLAGAGDYVVQPFSARELLARVGAHTNASTATWLDRYIDAADQPMVVAAIRHAIGTRSAFELEHRVKRPDGTLGWALSRAVPLLGDDGEIAEWIGTATDVTAGHEAGPRRQEPAG